MTIGQQALMKPVGVIFMFPNHESFSHILGY